MSKNEELASDIIKNIGGKENISGLTHCATRLRFNLKDKSKVNEEELEKLEILQAIDTGSQYQVVVGPQVGAVYQNIVDQGDYVETRDEDSDSQTDGSNNNENDDGIISKVFDVISGSFTPLIPIIVASGLLKALNTILVMANILEPGDSTHFVIEGMGNAVFYFFPVLLGITVAEKMGASRFIAAALGAALLEPNITGLIEFEGTTNFFGIPMTMTDYSSTVLPIFVAVIVLAYLEKFLKRVIPDQLHLIFVSFLSLLIMIPLTLLIFGPFGVYSSQLVGSMINGLIGFNPVIAGAVLSSVWLYVVTFGMHWAIIPLMIENIVNTGSDLMLGIMAGTVWAAGGIALGVFLKTKDHKLKNISVGGMISVFLSGVSEPVMYGILFRYKRTLVIYTITAAISGALGGFIGVEATQLAGGVFTIPTYLPIAGYLVLIAVSIILPVAMIMMFGYKDKEITTE